MALRLVSKIWSAADQTISFMWFNKDGAPAPMLNPKTNEPLVFNVGDCPDEQKVLYMLHGATQKVSDGFADAKGDKDLIARTVADAITSGLAGIWREKSADGVEREPAQLYEAMSRAFPLKFTHAADAKAWLVGKSPEVRKGMSKVPAVALAILDIKKENTVAKPAAESAAALAALDLG
jgi:hypothetical protein